MKNSVMKLIVDIDEELMKKIKLIAIESKTSIKDLVNLVLEEKYGKSDIRIWSDDSTKSDIEKLIGDKKNEL